MLPAPPKFDSFSASSYEIILNTDAITATFHYFLLVFFTLYLDFTIQASWNSLLYFYLKFPWLHSTAAMLMKRCSLSLKLEEN